MFKIGDRVIKTNSTSALKNGIIRTISHDGRLVNIIFDEYRDGIIRNTWSKISNVEIDKQYYRDLILNEILNE